MSLKDRLREWLFPGLLEREAAQAQTIATLAEHVDDHTMWIEANYDIHCVGLPAGPRVWEDAIANCEALHEDLQAGKIDRRGRGMSLITALERKGVIKIKPKNKEGRE